MVVVRRCLLAALCGLLCLSSAHAVAPDPPTMAAPGLPGDAGRLVRWVIQHADHRGRPFAVVDKQAARIQVFEPSGALLGTSPVLIGLTGGDRDAVPNLGARSVATLLPHERTTPAGRFDSEPGRNDRGEAIVWFNYDAALAIHRLRPAPAHERRPQRMLSSNPAEHRITYGCVVVPEAFYDDVIAPSLGRHRGVVYVLPETEPLEAMFSAP